MLGYISLAQASKWSARAGAFPRDSAQLGVSADHLTKAHDSSGCLAPVGMLLLSTCWYAPPLLKVGSGANASGLFCSRTACVIWAVLPPEVTSMACCPAMSALMAPPSAA